MKKDNAKYTSREMAHYLGLTPSQVGLSPYSVGAQGMQDMSQDKLDAMCPHSDNPYIENLRSEFRKEYLEKAAHPHHNRCPKCSRLFINNISCPRCGHRWRMGR